MKSVLVFQSGGPTTVINASLVGVIQAVRRSNRFNDVLGSRNGIEGLLSGDTVALGGLGDQRLTRLRRTPSAALGTTRHRPDEAEIDVALQRCIELGVGTIVGIGGNDTADTLLRLGQFAERRGIALTTMQVPKTIDNDLYGTDHCPGYGSMARYIALAVRDAAFDTAAMARIYPVKIIETMGRNAGWVPAAGSLLFPAEGNRPLICLPERPLSGPDALAEIVGRRVRGAGSAVLVVPETMRWADGKPVGGEQPVWVDAFGHAYYPSAGEALARLLRERLQLRARYDKPGTIARMAMHAASEVDLAEAELVGAAAVNFAADGVSGRMVSLRRGSDYPAAVACETVPLQQVANHERRLPDAFIDAHGTDVTEAFRSYALPLLGSAIEPYETLDDLPAG